ncbi:hypothetical protein BOX15_Mlig019668g1 [Macrostomum lignano]|nr:hypothetical protein BOX15_Mlig019668g1 [Macrostomum lignano]
MSGFVLATTLANDCARGVIANCPCGAEPRWLRARWPEVRFSLEGCHTNLRMGQRLARQFLGFAGKRKRARRRRPRGRRTVKTFDRFVKKVNRHNYRVGIRATKHSEAVRCKCHGSSASCTIRTCHKVLHQRGIQMIPSAYVRRYEDDPIDFLINLYDKQNLRRTIFDERGYQGYEERCTEADRQAGSNPLAAKPLCESYKVVPGLPRASVLLFKEHSLDYCSRREDVYPGTSNRECLPDGSPEAQQILASDTGERRREILCSVMCCGRPYRNVTVSYPGNHPDCKAKSCRLLQNPFRVDCQPCVLSKSFCS